MLSLRSSASLELGEPAVLGGRGLLLYAVTLAVAALLFVARFVRFYAQKRVDERPDAVLLPYEALADSMDSEVGAESESKEAADSLDGPEPEAEGPEVEVKQPPVRLAVYDFDETLTRATYPQAYDGNPFGCMSLSIPWDDPRAGAKSRPGDTSPTKEFGGFDDFRIASLQQHFAHMRSQGWTLAVLSYNLQWDRREFCLLELLRHYGLLSYFTHQGTPMVYGLKDMRRIGATSKGDFVVKLLRNPRHVTGLTLDVAPRGQHMLVDDDEANIAGARTCGLLGYQVAKRYEWDGMVGGLGRADPLDFVKLESIASSFDQVPVAANKRRRRRRCKAETALLRPEARWSKK